MTSKKTKPEIELTASEAKDLLEKRKREADRQKAIDDSRHAQTFMSVMDQDILALKLKRFDRLCSERTLSDETLEGMMPKLFGEAWERGMSDFSACKAIVAMIERTEPGRRAKREAAAQEIRNHPRDY